MLPQTPSEEINYSPHQTRALATLQWSQEISKSGLQGQSDDYGRPWVLGQKHVSTFLCVSQKHVSTFLCVSPANKLHLKTFNSFLHDSIKNCTSCPRHKPHSYACNNASPPPPPTTTSLLAVVSGLSCLVTLQDALTLMCLTEWHM